MSRTLRQIRERARFLSFALRLVWAAAPGYTAFWGSLLVVQGLAPPAIVALTKRVVDGANAAVGGGFSADNLAPILLPLGIIVVLYLVQTVSGAVSEWTTTAQAELVQDHIKALIHDRATKADFMYFESAEYHDLLNQVNSEAGSRTLQLLQSLGDIVRAGVSILSLGVLFVSYSVWIPVALLASTVPAFAVVLRHNRRYHTWWQASTPRRRRVQYYDALLTSDSSAAEVRIYGFARRFQEAYRALRSTLFLERIRLARRMSFARLLASLNAAVVTAVVLGWVGARAMRGEATLGDLALFFQAFAQGQGMVLVLMQGFGQAYTHTLFLEHLHVFLNQRDAVQDPPNPRPVPVPFVRGVRFEDVTFAYPGVGVPVLRGFSLDIPTGKVVAIVGENGAGKSTFIKLLCRFYDPDGGRITVDGTDLREFSQAELRSRISVMFQSPLRYQMTAEENILLGDVSATPDPAAVQEAAHAGGADGFIGRLPQGFQTLLGRQFEGGTELSGGEWQRIALSRAFLRRAPLVILDEPTSAMDSWSEAEWLTRFREMVAGQTALVITHRFTTAMQADVIHVVEHGEIVESGSHAELLALNGRYAQSWRAQMEQARSADSDEGTGDGAVIGAAAATDIP